MWTGGEKNILKSGCFSKYCIWLDFMIISVFLTLHERSYRVDFLIWGTETTLLSQTYSNFFKTISSPSCLWLSVYSTIPLSLCYSSSLRGDLSLGLYNRVNAVKEAVTVQVFVIHNLPVLVLAYCLCRVSLVLGTDSGCTYRIYMYLPCLLKTSNRELAALQKSG